MNSFTLLAVIAVFAAAVTSSAAPAKAVTPRVIDSELGVALGFQAYRYEAELTNEEALVVHEWVTEGTRRIEAEYAVVGTVGKASYDLVLVDSGYFHPSLRNIYMLRFPTSNASIDDVVLTGSSHGAEGVQFIFSAPNSPQVKITRRWSASVEKHADVRKRWPELPTPRANILSGSRRLILDTAPDPANPAAATPASISTRSELVAKSQGGNDSSLVSTTTVTQMIPTAGAMQQLHADAANNTIAAQVALAAAYYNGQGVTKDLSKAAQWMGKAAELGDSGAQHNLGAMYANGSGVVQDWALARTWYLKAAAQGNALAQSNLAANYANGRGGPEDYIQAFFWAKKAADQGLASSECDLGVMYEKGLGIPKDIPQAIVWYRRAAQQGDARAHGALQRLRQLP